MIGERYAPSTRVKAAKTVPRNSAKEESLIARPAVSGRERISQSLGSSVLVQLGLAMSLIAFAAMVYLFQASQESILEMNIADLQNQQVQLRLDNASLQMTASSLQSIQRVDSIATTQLHMTKPDISTFIWVRPVAPRVPALRGTNADVLQAQRQSQPLGWMESVATFVKSSL